jgi:hypothetical protein
VSLIFVTRFAYIKPLRPEMSDRERSAASKGGSQGCKGISSLRIQIVEICSYRGCVAEINVHRSQDHELQVGNGNAVQDQPEDIHAVMLPQWARNKELRRENILY